MASITEAHKDRIVMTSMEAQSMNSSVISYISAMALATDLLEQKSITRKEFLSFEGKMREKYGLPKCSIYRDFHLIYPKNKR